MFTYLLSLSYQILVRQDGGQSQWKIRACLFSLLFTKKSTVGAASSAPLSEHPTVLLPIAPPEVLKEAAGDAEEEVPSA